MASLFITGSSGFIAGHLARRLDLQRYEHVYFLSRSPHPIIDRLATRPNVTFIQGSLFDADRYAAHLEAVDTVLHLAAVTGKAKPEAYFRTNTEGTAFFVEQCERAGVHYFLHVSTIAVTYPDVARYYYAQSKQQAEDVVRRSGMKHTILRPTLVLGDASPLTQRFTTLANGPALLVFGNGKATLQPIHVDDLVTALLSILDEQRFDNETYDLGGPEQLTLGDFLQRMRRIQAHKAGPRIHVPLPPLLWFLARVEKVLFPLLPFTAGQLSVFRYDSTVAPNALHDRLAPGMKTVEAMLQPPSAALPADLLDRECHVFCTHLIGQPPNDYVRIKYREGNQTHRLEEAAMARPFDRRLVRIARKGPWFSKLADTYAAIFYKPAILRKKLILLLAILESCAPTHRLLDAGQSVGTASYYATLLTKGFGFAFTLLVSTVVFTPWHLALGRRGSTRGA